MQLFTITDSNDILHDFTTNIVVPSYNVTRQDIYEEWTDGYRVNHREIYRGRTSGTFTMLFQSFSDYLDFIDILESVKAVEGYYPAAFYLNNKNEIDECNVYIDFTPVINPKQQGNVEPINVTIAER